MSRLQSMIGSGAHISEIAKHLDSLSEPDRLAELYALGSADQAALYDRASESPPLGLDHFVGSDVPPRTEVIHFGKNSQPLFRMFEKRFCRPEGDEGRLFGYNEGSTRSVIGPGYFVARPTESGDERGAVVVDYFLVPDMPVVQGWPAVKPNSSGLQRFVFNKTRDYMRRVSEHACIGKAIRLERRTMGYFVLSRKNA